MQRKKKQLKKVVHIHTIGFVALDREKESLDSEKETKTYEQEASVS